MATLGALWEDRTKRKCATLLVSGSLRVVVTSSGFGTVLSVGSGKWNELTKIATHHSMSTSYLVRGTHVETCNLVGRRGLPSSREHCVSGQP